MESSVSRDTPENEIEVDRHFEDVGDVARELQYANNDNHKIEVYNTNANDNYDDEDQQRALSRAIKEELSN